MSNSKFYLKDRMNFNFRILPDNSITTIYNSKTLSIKFNDINISSVRIDILDENTSKNKHIIDIVNSKKLFECKDFTNGYFSNL